MLNSDYRRLCRVNLPHKFRQMYMHSFDISNPIMPIGYEDYLEPVTQLCKFIGVLLGIAHMTVDEKIVPAGMSQRRPGPHVDGCFSVNHWGHDPPTNPGWLHECNNIPLKEFKRMPVIIAANAIGSRAWRGEFNAEPKSDGDLSHLELGLGEILEPNVGYLLSPDCVHESMVLPVTIRRSFLRIALPINYRFRPAGNHSHDNRRLAGKSLVLPSCELDPASLT